MDSRKNLELARNIITKKYLDFMIGSGEMNVDGILEDETAEPIMRNGEWAFDV